MIIDEVDYIRCTASVPVVQTHTVFQDYVARVVPANKINFLLSISLILIIHDFSRLNIILFRYEFFSSMINFLLINICISPYNFMVLGQILERPILDMTNPRQTNPRQTVPRQTNPRQDKS